MHTSEPITSKSGSDDRLSSWKEIAAYLKSGVRTVQRWERLEGLPVHRHRHQTQGTVYAFKSEVDVWRRKRANLQSTGDASGNGFPTDVNSQGSEFVEALEPGSLVASDATGANQGTENETASRNSLATAIEEPGPKSVEPGAPNDDFAGQIPTYSEPVLNQAPANIPSASRSRLWSLARYALPLTLLAAAAGAAYFVNEHRKINAKPEIPRKMLAVLPFANLSGDPSQDYFSDGLTEEMITELGRLDPDRLGVIARTSAMKYKHTQEDIAQIGRELGVGYVLEGSVRRAQNRVRVSAQLIQVSDQTHLWAQSYEGDMRNVLGVQEQVAQAITKKIQINLGRAPLSSGRTVDLDAYDNYLKGRYFWNLRSSEGFHKAIDYFDAAIQQDPNYAEAYAGLADCYTLLALYGEPVKEVMPRAKTAALKSVALGDSLPETHTSLGAVEALWDWNWPAAQHDFERAIELNPNYSPAHHWYANLYLIPQLRLDEALTEMKLAATLDPVSLIVTTDLGWTYFVAHQYDRAFEQYSKALEMSPDFVPLHFRLAQYYVQLGAYDKALAETQAAARLDGYPDFSVTETGQPTPVTQEDFRKYIRRRLDDMTSGRLKLRGPQGREFRPEHGANATFYSQIGDTEHAIQGLQAAVSERDPGMIYIAVDPEFASLHSDPRFQEVERRVGLPVR